jgi:hypothetical protein
MLYPGITHRQRRGLQRLPSERQAAPENLENLRILEVSSYKGIIYTSLDRDFLIWWC